MINQVVERFEKSIANLITVFMEKDNDYFFTEKELHSYFYHLCLSENLNYLEYNLVHTEYPTPFKCQTSDQSPYIMRADNESKNQRAHIDLVLLNPNYIEFTMQNKKDDRFRYLTGIGGKLFSLYIGEFYSSYNAFSERYKESILLYAIEFKYHRHSYSGEKYPARYLIQDINKLDLMRNFKLTNKVAFCQKIKSLVFIGDRISKKSINSLRQIAIDHSDVCSLYIKEYRNRPTTAST